MFKTVRFLLVALSTLMFLLAQTNSSAAQEQRWTNAAGGDFFEATNWDSDVPDDTEDARFDLDATYGVNLTGDQTIAGFFQDRGILTLSGGFGLSVLQPANINDGTLNLSGAGTQFNQSGEFAIGRDGGNANFNVFSGATLSTEVGRIGYTNDATGSATIDGVGSQWLLSSTLIVGRDGTGNLTVQNGGQVLSERSLTVAMAGTTGSVLVTGNGSRFVSALNTSQVGAGGTGTLRIENEGEATFSSLIVGNGTSGNGSVLVDGIGSNWNVTGSTTVGGSGTGSVEIRNGGSASAGSILTIGTASSGMGTININSGGSLVSHLSRVGHVSASSGVVNVSGANSQWNITNQLFVGNSGDGTVSISDGGHATVNDFVRVGASSGSTGTLNVADAASELVSNGLDVGFLGQGTMSITNSGLVTTGFVNIGRQDGGNGTAVVDGAGSRWNNANTFNIGAGGAGSLTISNGGFVSTLGANVSQSPGSDGTLLVTGDGSQFLTDSIGAGGVATVEMGGLVHNTGFAGLGSNGTITIRDTGSQWINDGQTNIGGNLIVESEGSLTTNAVAFIGPTTNTSGSVVVRGSGSTWNSQGLGIGRFGTGHLEISDGGFVSNQFMGIGSSGGVGSVSVQGNGSRLATNNFEIGIAGDGSVMVSNGGRVEAGSVFLISDGMGSQSEFTVTGQGSLLTGTGELRIGDGSPAAGNLFVLDGGSVSFDGPITISELGVLTLDQGELLNANQAVNQGQILVTGDSVLSGGLELRNNGRIATSNNSATLINGDVNHRGLEVFTEQGSQILFADDVGGAGSFTGLGEVAFAGEYAPGNSPAIIDFEGDVSFLNDSLLTIELGTINAGEFDQLLIDGDLSLNGVLAVTLVGGLELTDDMEFLIADIGGVRSGQFDGLGEGALIGNFGSQALHISYAKGDGNDIGLFTLSSVPEPGGMLFLLGIGISVLSSRRRTTEG